MLIEQIMTRPVQSCRPEDSLARAAELMWKYDCGSLPVLGGDGTVRVVGMITDRDICMCAWSQGKPLADLRVATAMSKQAYVCRPGDTPADAERIMREAQVRRLPVIDEDDTLVGVISMADLAEEAARERAASSPSVTEAEVGDTLAAITKRGGHELSV